MGKTDEQKTSKNSMINADKNPIPGNKKFGRDQSQPSPEAKSRGWERRRQAQEMMDKVKEYMNLSQTEFIELLEDIKNNPSKYTVQDVLLYKYATKAFNGEKFMIDWFDRNISKAPQDIDVKSDGEKIQGIIVEFVNKHDDQNASDKRTSEDVRSGEAI